MYKQKYKEGQQIHKDIYLYICRYIKEMTTIHCLSSLRPLQGKLGGV